VRVWEDLIMTEQEERYIHFASCIENFNKAWRILKEIKSNKDNSVFVGWSFQFALVEYSKPYTPSFGFTKRWKLEKDYIPLQYKKLHKEIIDGRNQIHAHSDLTVKDANLIVENLRSEKFVGILQNKIDPTYLMTDIDKIIDLIEKTLDKMYLKRNDLEKDLPVKK
jgi:hypothetical protein